MRHVSHRCITGFLSFALFYLIKHPEVMRRAQAEIDDLIGDQQIQVDDLSQLPYLTGIFSLSHHNKHLS